MADGDLLMFFHVDYLVEYKDKKVPPQFVVMYPNKGKEKEGNYIGSYQQSWGWRNAKETIENSSFSVLATDMMASGLPYQERIQLFRNSLRALLEVVACNGVHFQPSQQFVRPNKFLESFTGDSPDQLFGVLNVRFFNIEGSGEFLMDTLGLAAIGLPDLQCHFKGGTP